MIVIHAFLNPIERGCNYSKHFKEQWIENDTLHPKVKEVKVKVQKTYFTPQINVYKDDHVIISMKSNMINPAKLQEELLKIL